MRADKREVLNGIYWRLRGLACRLQSRDHVGAGAGDRCLRMELDMAPAELVASLPEVAAKPTAAYDAKWGQFVINPPFFTKLVYEGV